MPLSAIILQQKSLHSAEASHKYPCQMVSYGTHSIYCKYLVEFIFKKNSPFHLKWFNTELALISGEWMILQIVAKLAKTSLWRKYTVLPLLNCVHWCMYGKLSKKWTQLANFLFKIFRCLSQSQTKSPYFLNLWFDYQFKSYWYCIHLIFQVFEFSCQHSLWVCILEIFAVASSLPQVKFIRILDQNIYK